jgi:hypothetical protein
MSPSGWHRAENLASRTTTQFQMVESSEDKDGGRYRIRTYDFHRAKVVRCFVIRELRGAAQECSGAYFSKTYEHGPESWTHKWTHVKPGWHPVFSRLASHFGGGNLANYCGLISSARWQLDPLQLPQVSYNAPLHFRLLLVAGFGWFHGQKADIRAPASASSPARQWKMRMLGA